ncbi:MAG: hypothetical protein A2Z35_06105 [Actinobacteria bacterium RBG_19FT_COMBO_36_27]|nr:MAG: hypothetical protein A2Z35_06105 [Actinobacteria bacterium RBG_19FT_COMBO_36_27]
MKDHVKLYKYSCDNNRDNWSGTFDKSKQKEVMSFIAGSSFFIGFIIRIIIYCLGFMIGILKAMELGCWQFFLIGMIAFGLGLTTSIKDLIFFEIFKLERRE